MSGSIKLAARVIGLLLASAVAVGATPALAQSSAGIALVIGNADYNADGRIDTSEVANAVALEDEQLPDLRNALNDAADIATVFRRRGFDVELAQNLDQVGLREALNRLAERSRRAPEAAVVIYYAGHGVSIDRRYFMLPVRLPVPSADLTEGEAIGRLRQDAALMDWRIGGRPFVFIYDACADNPWYGRILPNLQPPPEIAPSWTRRDSIFSHLSDGDVIAFSAADNEFAQDGRGRNSPYTAALVEQLAAPSVSLKLALERAGRSVFSVTNGTQTPWYFDATDQGCWASATDRRSAMSRAFSQCALPAQP